MLLDFLLSRPKGVNNPFEYYPDSYPQDSNKSIITADGRYDLKHFSAHEVSIIQTVLSTVNKKYPSKLKSIGLANESYVITYKPRYVLFEIIVIKYQNSDSPLDQFSVAYAYAMKGAQFRKRALNFFEKSIKNIHFSTLDKFASVNSAFVYMKFSELYEQEWEFDKAVFWLKQAIKREGLNNQYLRDRINKIEERKAKVIEKNLKKRAQRKPSSKDTEFEIDVHNAALRFI